MIHDTNHADVEQQQQQHSHEPQEQQHRQHTVSQDLAKKCVHAFAPPQQTANAKRVSTNAAAAISEVVRLFVVEAHARASIEVSGKWRIAFSLV